MKSCSSSITSVLHQGREFAVQLRKQLNITHSSSSSNLEAHGFLLNKILLAYDDALALAKCMPLLDNRDGSDPESNQSDGSEPDEAVFKKRKTMPRWCKQIRVCSSTGQGQLDDGHSWRKYGQKKILGTNHPRSYYRCTHRNTQGCLATKQVQRTDEDSSIFEIIHHGKHTCVSETLTDTPPHIVPELECIDEEKKDENNEKDLINNEELGLRAEKKKIQEITNCSDKEQEFPLIYFPSTPIGSESMKDLLIFPDHGSTFETKSSAPFLFPTTPDQFYFSPGSYCYQSSELDFAKILSNPYPTPFTDFQFGELDFSIDQVNFDSHCFLNPCDYFNYSTTDSPT